MASSALAFLPPPTPVTARAAMYAIDQARAAQPRVVTRHETVPTLEIDLGLRAGVKVEYTPHRSSELPLGLTSLVDEIRRIEALPSGWDSYGGYVLNDRAVVPAIEVALESLKRCAAPRVVPLSSGGLGLRWESATAELEIDVAPTGLASGLFEDLTTGETLEVGEPGEVQQMFPLVHRLCNTLPQT